MTAYFVTSTGTDIGKTFVTAGLIRYLRGTGQAINALKPVVSGYDSSVVETSDPAVLLGALGRQVSADEIATLALPRAAGARYRRGTRRPQPGFRSVDRL
jgi:dethiobiotin synthetase